MDLLEIREHLDRLDKILILILAERISLISKVAEYKKKENIMIYQQEREKAILNNVVKLAEEQKLNPKLIENIFELIIEDSHRIQKEVKGE